MQENSNTKRIAKNTLMLYIRQIIILLVNLYVVRVVLNTLGAEDYGIYNVVAGVVTMLSFLNGTMASATQRFFSFALGEGNQEKLNKIFISNLVIYIAIVILAVILLETIGVLFVYNKLVMPTARIEAAHILYHFTVFTFVFYVISAPLIAMIIAHEDMNIYAYTSIIEAVLKLIIAFILRKVDFDKLVLYGIFLFLISIINASIYLFYCLKKYSECKFNKKYFDIDLMQEIINFTGWTLFGQISIVARNQGITVLVNQMFSPVMVTARGLAVSVSNYVSVFANNFNVGMYPAIIKEYASGNISEMMKLVFSGCKFTFFLMWFFTLPLILEMEHLLTIWLKIVPQYTVFFTKLALIEVLINTLSLPISTAARAPGNMKKYELSLGGLQLLIFLLSYIFLKMKFEVYWVFVIAIGINCIMFFVRLIIVSSLINLDIWLFIKEVLLPITFTVIVSSFISCLFCYYITNDYFFVFVKILFSILTSSVCMLYIGMTRYERNDFVKIIIKKIMK